MIDPMVPNLAAMAGAWFQLLLLRAVEASVLAVLVLVAVRAGRHRLSAPFRHGLLLLVILKFLLPPVAAPWAPARWLPDLPVSLPAAELAPAPPAQPTPLDRAGHAPLHDATALSGSTAAKPPSGSPADRGEGADPERTSGPAGPPPQLVASPWQSPEPDGGARSWWPVLLLLHGAGALLLLGRHMVLRYRLGRLARRFSPLEDPGLHGVLRAAGTRQRIRRLPVLVTSPDHFGPAAAGLLRPRIVLPHEVLAGLPAERLRPVLDHELAHHRRRDLWVELAVFLGSLVWWPCPLYWLTVRELRRAREDCCDAAALATVSPASYCRTLLDIATVLGGARPTLPALAHGSLSHPLARRIKIIMTTDQTPRASLTLPAILLLAAAAVVFLPGASDGSPPEPSPSATESSGASVLEARPATTAVRASTAGGGTQSLSIRNDEITIDRRGVDRLVENGLTRAFAEQLDGTTDRRLTISELRDWSRHGVDSGLADELAAWGYDGVWVSEIIRLVWSDVRASYLRAIRELDYADFDLDDLIRLARYEVAASDIGAWADAGYTDLDADDLVRLQRYEVAAGYAATYAAAGYDLSVDDLVRLNRYEVDEDAAARLAAAGLDDFSVDDLVRLARYEVSDDYIRQMTADGADEVSVDDLVRLRRYEVGPAYAAAFRNAGLEVSTDDLIRLSRYEVNPMFATHLLGLGYADVDVDGLITLNRYEVSSAFVDGIRAASTRAFRVDDLVRLKRYEVTPTWLASMAAVGYGDLGADDLVRLRRYEVTGDFIRRLQDAGFENLTVDRIIRLKRSDS